MFQVSGTQAVRRLSLELARPGKRATLAEVDLDSDGLKEREVVRAACAAWSKTASSP